METNELKKELKEHFARAAAAKGLRIEQCGRYTIIGHKKVKDANGFEVIRYYRLGEFNQYFFAFRAAKINASSGEWDRQYIFNNYNGYYTKINAAGEAE